MSSGIPDYAPPEDYNLHKQEALCRHTLQPIQSLAAAYFQK